MVLNKRSADATKRVPPKNDVFVFPSTIYRLPFTALFFTPLTFAG